MTLYNNYDELIKEQQIQIYSDLYYLVKLYRSLGIECKIYVVPPNRDGSNKLYQIQLAGNDNFSSKKYSITINEKFNLSDEGSYCEIIFDDNGKFLRQCFFSDYKQ